MIWISGDDFSMTLLVEICTENKAAQLKKTTPNHRNNYIEHWNIKHSSNSSMWVYWQRNYNLPGSSLAGDLCCMSYPPSPYFSLQCVHKLIQLNKKNLIVAWAE